MIVAQALTKRYRRTLAVDDLSFEVTPGVVTGFLGPNGSGKSTTMRMIMGLDNPTSGTALVNGKKLAQLKWPLRDVGALLDAKAFHPARSAYNHLLFLAQSNDIPRRASTRCSRSWASPRSHTSAPAAIRSAWDSASASPVHCSGIPGCCSSTSPSTGSTRRGSAGSGTCCVISRPKVGRSSSRAT